MCDCFSASRRFRGALRRKFRLHVKVQKGTTCSGRKGTTPCLPEQLGHGGSDADVAQSQLSTGLPQKGFFHLDSSGLVGSTPGRARFNLEPIDHIHARRRAAGLTLRRAPRREENKRENGKTRQNQAKTAPKIGLFLGQNLSRFAF